MVEGKPGGSAFQYGPIRVDPAEAAEAAGEG